MSEAITASPEDSPPVLKKNPKRRYDRYKKWRHLDEDEVLKTVNGYHNNDITGNEAAERLGVSKTSFYNYLKRYYGGVRSARVEDERRLNVHRGRGDRINLKYYKKIVIYVLEEEHDDYKGPQVVVGENNLESSSMEIKITSNIEEDDRPRATKKLLSSQKLPGEVDRIGEESEGDLAESANDESLEDPESEPGDYSLEDIVESNRKRNQPESKQTPNLEFKILRKDDTAPKSSQKSIREPSPKKQKLQLPDTEENQEAQDAATVIEEENEEQEEDEGESSRNSSSYSTKKIGLEGDQNGSIIEQVFGTKYLLSPQLQPTMIALEDADGRFWTYIHTGRGRFKCFNCKAVSDSTKTKFAFPCVQMEGEEFTEPDSRHYCGGSSLAGIIGTELDRKNRKKILADPELAIRAVWEEGLAQAEKLNNELGLPLEGDESLTEWYPDFANIKEQYLKIKKTV